MNPPTEIAPTAGARVLHYAVSAMAAATIACATSLVQAEDWPLARGNLQSSGVAQSAVPDEPDVLWSYKAGEDAGFDATAVIASGIIYVGDNAGVFHAIKLDDGGAKWTKTFKDSFFGAPATIVDDRLYVGDLNGVVRCLATADGTEKWQQTLAGEVYAGPTPHDDAILVTSEAGTLSSLHQDDGRELWTPFKIDAPLRCSPTITGGHALLAGCDSLLHLINVEDGTETATVEIDGPTGATAALHGQHVYFGTEGGTLFAIKVPHEGEPEVAWTYQDRRRGQPIRAAAAVNDQLVVYGGQGKAIYGIDRVSGEQKWIFPTRSRIESSPVIAKDRVLAATTAGKLYLLDAVTGEVVWEQDFGGGFTASPAVVDGKIIIGNADGTLYCLGDNDQVEKPAR